MVSGCQGGRKNVDTSIDKTKTHHFTHTYSDITGEKDLLAGNGRRQGRHPPNRGRQIPNPVNVRRNPNRAARAVPGRGPVPPQPQPPIPQAPIPQAPIPQPVGPQPQPVGLQPQPRRVPPGGPGGPGPGGPGGPGPGGPGGPGPGGPGGPIGPG